MVWVSVKKPFLRMGNSPRYAKLEKKKSGLKISVIWNLWVESSSVCAEEVRRDVQLWVSAESVKQNADMNPLHHVNLMVLEFLLKLINYDCRKAQSEFDPPCNTVWKAWQWYQTHCKYSKSIIQICVQTHKLSFFLYFHLVWTCFNILVHWFPMFQIKYKWIRV